MTLPTLKTVFTFLLVVHAVLVLPQANAWAVGPRSPSRSAAIPSSCYSPTGSDCGWYRNCFEREIPCAGRDGDYAIAYATNYCHRYQTNYARFSRRGQRWVDAVKKCLQVNMVPMLRESPSPSCPEVKTRTFAMHVPCYLHPSPSAPSYCELSFRDKLSVFRTIWTALGSEFLATFRGALAVAARCL